MMLGAHAAASHGDGRLATTIAPRCLVISKLLWRLLERFADGALVWEGER